MYSTKVSEIDNLFIELIRVAVGAQDCLSRLPKVNEWGKLYRMAEKQSLVGVCFAALQRLGADADEGFARIGISEMLYLTWMGVSAKIQQKNQIVDEQCVVLQKLLSANGLRACVLKGQGIARLYVEHLHGLRQSGDIDMWVKGGFDVVNDFVQKTVPTDDIAYHRFHYDIFSESSTGAGQATEVELHHRPTLMRNLFDNRKLQKWCDSFGAYSFEHLDLGFDVPPIEFNRIFILTHIYRHFLFEGVGLRQVMDYYFVLRAASKVVPDASSIQKVSEVNLLKEFRLTRFAGALMWVMKHVFGMDDKYLICEPDEKEGRFLLNEIMETGNFGQGETRFIGQSRLQKMINKRLHLITHYPSEVMWTPIWLVYHKIWKLKYKRKTR